MMYDILVTGEGDVLSIITISRQDGSLGMEIAGSLAARLNMQLIVRDRVISEWLPEIADNYELHMLGESPKFYLNSSKKGVSFKEYIENRLKAAAETVPSIIVGMGAQVIFADHPDAVRVRIIASDKVRIQRIKNKYGLGVNEAENMIEQSDKRHKRYITALYGVDWSENLSYDLTLNTDRLSIEQCVELIALQVELKKSMHYFGLSGENNLTGQIEPKEVNFKHPAEEEFARILNMYGIEWQYEPRTFPVAWDAEGNVTMAFSPDFYLVKFDTYIEITTMEQKYVTTKNKKVKRLRELYPGININIVYKKDFHSLLKRFGFSGGDEIDEFNRSQGDPVQ
jgi:cytidylate kinase